MSQRGACIPGTVLFDNGGEFVAHCSNPLTELLGVRTPQPCRKARLILLMLVMEEHVSDLIVREAR